MSQQYATSIADIDRERARLRRILRKADPRAIATRPPGGAWSALENVRHLLFAEQLHLGRFASRNVGFSPLGMTAMTARRFADVGTQPTSDVAEVLAAWDAIHRPIRNALKDATGADAEKALWGNHRHLGIHIAVIERLLRNVSK